MPLVAVAFVLLVASGFLSPSGLVRVVVMIVFVVAMALYLRVGTPQGDPVDVGSPVTGSWEALNSPTSKVPSHGLHAWAQTYAVDLVHRSDGDPSSTGWWPVTTPPDAFSGFGRPVRSPVDGTVVKSVDVMRDHRTRTSWPGLVYFALESVRELLGPIGILGNHVTIRRDDGVFVLMAHLRRHSLRVARGDQVTAGEQIAECGNSGNTTEPHLHLQIQDHPSPWIATPIPLTLNGQDLPENRNHLSPEQREPARVD